MAAAQQLKLWEGMLGKQVAGSPWSNARHLQKDQVASAVSLFPTSMQTKRHEVHQIHGTNGEKLGGKTWKPLGQNTQKNWRKIGRNMDQEPFGHTLRRESNPGLLSERRGAADRQKC